jgi:thioredoxin reductase (NADPH)
MIEPSTAPPTSPSSEPLDCLVVGAGPAGLTAGLYLARYGRSFAVVDAGDPRAAWIPVSHNIPFFGEGISGPDILARGAAHLGRYGAPIVAADIRTLRREPNGLFLAEAEADGGVQRIAARRVILATGADDVEPELPDIRQAVRRGLVRYCPICDGFEARGKPIAVIGHGARGLGEAVFLAETYGADVTLMTLGADEGDALELSQEERDRAGSRGVAIVRAAVARIETDQGRIAALITTDGRERRFGSIYSALGLLPRSGLAAQLGADRGDCGSVLVDDHCRTSVPGLYAAGGVVKGLDQVVIAMGHAAVAATDAHNGLRKEGLSLTGAARAAAA